MHKAIALVALLALAGCSGETPEATDEDGTPLAGSIVDAPTWAVGDWWSVSDQMGRAYSIVVAGEQGSDWTVLSNDRDIAFVDFRFDLSYLGAVRKADLAGSQGSDRPKYFEWPLEDGKMWTTTWDGASRTLTASLGTDGRFTITGTTDGTTAVEYVYNPASKWLDSLTFYNMTGGDVQYQWTATGHGDSFRGTLYRYTEVQERMHVEQQGPGNTQAIFPVAEGVSELVVSWDAQCQGTGYMANGLQPPNEDGSARPAPPLPPPFEFNEEVYGFAGQCPQIDGPGMELVPEPAAGDWRSDGVVGSNTSGYWFTVTARTYESIIMGS